jgi:pSer/pThr/pTyr-binding forkhead associated (FHA) protein
MAGKKIAIVTGQTVTFGRAAGRAQFALPQDTFMSGVHFAVECGPGGCRVQDRKSSNGTFLNGARIQDAMLANGDEIKGGQTIFAVKIVADATLASMTPPEDAAPTSTVVRRRRAVQLAPRPDPPAAPPAEELKSAPSERASGLPQPSRAPVVESEPSPPAGPRAAEPADSPPAMSASDFLDAVPDLRRASVDPRPRKLAPSAEPPGRKISAASETPPVRGLPPKPAAPAEGLQPRAAGPANDARPPLEEPPRFHAIPSPPVEGPKPPHVGGHSPGAGAKTPRDGEPPAGVAPYLAEKFLERPAARGTGSPRGLAFSVMGWSFPAAPPEWQVQEGFGLQQSGHEEFPSSVAASEELLGGITLQQFVESQISTLRRYLRDPKIEPTMPPRVGGADESMAMDVRHSTKDGRELVYRRIYARSGSSVGVLTVTTLAADLAQVLQSLQPLLDGAAFRATVNN